MNVASKDCGNLDFPTRGPSDVTQVAQLYEFSPPQTMPKRHRGVVLSFCLLVFLPSALGAIYLFTRAADQYASTVAFSVRKEDVASPIEMFGGIAGFGSSGTSDADILNDFIGSQEIVRALDDQLGLAELFAKPRADPVFSYHEDGSIEDLHDYWRRMVRVIYDPGTGLIEVRTLAFDAEDARAISAGVFAESARLVDALSAIAQEDTTEFARAELARAVARMREARARLTEFRSRTQIVDPNADVQGQMGLLSMLEQQLAEALINADLLRESTRAADPRLRQADRRIAVIKARIKDERGNLGFGGRGGTGEDYATLLGEFERLAVDRQFAEEAYTVSLAAFDLAQAEARRKSRYLAAHIRPTLAETPQYPRRFMLSFMISFFLCAVWSVGVLVFYSLRDRR
jgi:capsular polysaccharide transport system permease protein